MPPDDGADRPLTPIVFSTEAVEPPDQRDYWLGKYGSFNRLELPDAARDGFTAFNEIWNLGDVALLRNFGPAIAFERSSQHIRRDSLDHLVIRLTRFGETRYRAGDACVEAPPLLPMVFSLGEPYAGERSEADWISLYIPRDRFPELSAGLGRLTWSTIDTSGGRLLADYMLSLHRRLPQMLSSQIPMLVQATRSMISACLLHGIDAATRPAAAPSSPAQFEVVRRIVRQHIGSPTLGPEKIGRLAGMSRSQLYRLFEPHGGVAHYVQRLRLQMVHAMLTDAATAQLPIAATAERAGFFDASAFSRAFRREFGYTPREARAMASDGCLSLAGGARPQGASPGTSFGTLLRQLGAFGGERAEARPGG